MVMVPQRASLKNVEVVDTLPRHPLLDDLKLVGIALTSASESSTLQPGDAVWLGNLMAKHHELGEDAALISVALTPGSLSLSAFALEPAGFEFTRNADTQTFSGYKCVVPLALVSLTAQPEQDVRASAAAPVRSNPRRDLLAGRRRVELLWCVFARVCGLSDAGSRSGCTVFADNALLGHPREADRFLEWCAWRAGRLC